MNEKLQTKFGTAILYNDEYYIISSRKEGNHSKKLHRLIYESIWGKIPKGYEIHHIDGDTTNNCILNLLMIKHSHHSKIHNCGNDYRIGKRHNVKTKRNISKNTSKSKNNTGFFRVSIRSDKRYKEGIQWRYLYKENNKRIGITSINLKRLKEKVLSEGLEWSVLNKDKGRATCDEYDYDFEELCS